MIDALVNAHGGVEEIDIEEIDDEYNSTRTGSPDILGNRENPSTAASGAGGSTGEILDTLLPGQVNSKKVEKSLSISRRSDGNASNETIVEDYKAARQLGIHRQSTTPPLLGDASKNDCRLRSASF